MGSFFLWRERERERRGKEHDMKEVENCLFFILYRKSEIVVFSLF